MELFASKFQKLHSDFALGLRKLTEHEIERIHAMDPADGMQSSRNANLKMLEHCQVIAEAYRVFASDVRDSVEYPLSQVCTWNDEYQF